MFQIIKEILIEDKKNMSNQKVQFVNCGLIY